MKTIASILTLLGVMLFSIGCTKSPETPVKSIDNNTSIVVESIENNTSNKNTTDVINVVTDNNLSDANSTNTITVITDENNLSNTNNIGTIKPMLDIVVITEANTTNPIDILLSKIKNKKLTSSEERKVYTSFNSVSNTYPITINGVQIKSYDRTLSYDHINGHNLTACIRTKDVIITSKNKTKKFKVCQTTNYDWIVK